MTLFILLADNSDITAVALWTLVPFTLAFAFIVFVFYRSRRESLLKQKEAELKQQLAEVEMKALRAQMNPHFIFNCMNSIHRFIEKNETSQAGDYLLRFSNLIRMVLENSMYREVSLEEDLKVLHLYIQMEQLRMGHKFDYVIYTDKSIDASAIFVPPLIIQPFAENAIWHGLNAKKDKGNLSINITKAKDMIKYLIEDNGEEQKPADENKNKFESKKKSLGMSLTRERLEVLNKTKNADARFTISDIRDEKNNYCGKRVELYIPVESE